MKKGAKETRNFRKKRKGEELSLEIEKANARREGLKTR